MIERILVPLDGSQVSESVLGPVVPMAQSLKASLTLFHAVTPAEYFSVTAAQHVHDERQRTSAYLRTLAERLGREGTPVGEQVITGEPSREIVAEAQRIRADLIAMSSHGRSGIKDWAFGSVTERVLRTTRTPVLVFREGQLWWPMVRKILVAVDGSEESLEVLGPVMDVASAMKASVTLVHAGRRLPASLPLAEKLLAARHVPFEAKLLPGEPAESILNAVRKERADLAALTTTGRSSDGRGTVGSVADLILKQCGRPMLVVHTGRFA
jgi:nucleotide-binding universal stress UspA family protein